MRRLLVALSTAVFVFIVVGRTENASHGKELFERRCSGCHSLDRDKEGPRLGGVYGRVSGSVQSFTYSAAVKSARIKWDADSLDKWLTDPAKLVPESNMAFHVDSAAERSEIIAYLREVR
jgi:cytochrome c